MSAPQPPADRRVKIPHLVFALLFLGLVVIWSLGTSGVLRGESLTILGPAVLVAAGVIGLGASLAGSRSRNRDATLAEPFTEPFTGRSSEGEEAGRYGYDHDEYDQPVPSDDTEELR